ncbi:Rne/Rng family ribonuclease [Propionibacteriaceae bacterium G1746]
MLDENTTENSTPVDEPQATRPVRRRRAATRPSGPPSTAVKPAVVTTPEPVADAPQPEPVPQPEPEPAPLDQPEAAAEADTTAEEDVVEPAPRKTAARKTTPRKRAAREEGAPTTTRRRKKAAEPVTSPSADEPMEASESTDELGERLRAAAEAAAGRQGTGRAGRKVSGVVANPFATSGDGDAAAVLQSLAASIAGAAPVVTFDAAPVAEDEAEDEAEVEVEATAEQTTAETDEQAATEAPEATEVVAQDAVIEDESSTDESATDDAATDDATTEDESSEDSDDEGDSGNRRRRRRRGGRRRRRGSDSAEAEADTDAEASTDEGDETTADATEATEGDENVDQADTGRRRRRRRRRRGEDASGADDDPSDVVVRVREPRAHRSAADEVTGIEGSTRLEAKRQRRREGRAAGRRRAPILSEAEFLARRESVKRSMLIRQRADYTQLAVLEDDILVEHYVDRATAQSLIGNVYLGRVQNVLPSMEAAFIDIGRGRNAVLYAGEVDWDSFGAQGSQRKVEQVFKSGQTVLVQVSKDPVGAKGARLTSHISIPGRYVVYSPGGQLSGISRKLADTERHRLKEILGHLIDEDSSVIVRTAAEGASEDELVRDVTRLKAQWEAIEKKVKQGSAPQLLYAEPVPTVRIVRDLFTEDFHELVVEGAGGTEDVGDTIINYVEHVAPHLLERVKRHEAGDGDLWAKYRIDEQISKALERKVFLPSGGSLVIDRTEAMTVIDVNTGRFTGSAGNLEATVTSNNLEAAEEVVRQLRLRDIGGIIVIDFIDMVLPSNRELLLRRLTECLARDRTRHQVAEVSSLGLVQMTRKKIGTGLAEAFTEQCEHCGGRGYHKFTEPVDSQAPADGGDRHRRGGGHGPVPAMAHKAKTEPVKDEPAKEAPKDEPAAEEPAPRRRRARRAAGKPEPVVVDEAPVVDEALVVDEAPVIIESEPVEAPVPDEATAAAE